MSTSPDDVPEDDDFDTEDDDLDFDDFDELADDELVGRLPNDEPYGADNEAAFFSDPDEGLPPDQARSRRAMLGVPEPSADEDDEPPTPMQAMQDALIDRMNDVLEDEGEWSAASEIAYEALTIDPTYGRAANALLRCYLTHAILREMQDALRKRFNLGDELPNERQRVLAHSYHLLTRAELWNDWPIEPLAESSAVADLLAQGRRALRHAFYAGDQAQYRHMRQAFADAIAQAHDKLDVMWYLARLYANYAFFADSAALLSAMVAAGSHSRDAQRLYAEMLWWRDQNRWLPWVH